MSTLSVKNSKNQLKSIQIIVSSFYKVTRVLQVNVNVQVNTAQYADASTITVVDVIEVEDL